MNCMVSSMKQNGIQNKKTEKLSKSQILKKIKKNSCPNRRKDTEARILQEMFYNNCKFSLKQRNFQNLLGKISDYNKPKPAAPHNTTQFLTANFGLSRDSKHVDSDRDSTWGSSSPASELDVSYGEQSMSINSACSSFDLLFSDEELCFDSGSMKGIVSLGGVMGSGDNYSENKENLNENLQKIGNKQHNHFFGCKFTSEGIK